MTEVKVIRETPPEIWLKDCTDYLPHIDPITETGELALIVGPLVNALLQCNADKKALREWSHDPD
jgi:hypothetical protein